MIDVKALRDPNKPHVEAWGDLQDVLDEVERLHAEMESLKRFGDALAIAHPASVEAAAWRKVRTP